MRKPNFTAGPWTLHSCGADTNEVVGDGMVVAVAWRADTDPANAKLIAASPLLAEAAHIGHHEQPGPLEHDLVEAARLASLHGYHDLAIRLQDKYHAEREALRAAGYEVTPPNRSQP